MRPIRILLVDDHALLREGLSERLSREPHFQVVAAASSGEEAIEEAARQSPDVIVMDIDMPGLNCFDAARTILKENHETRVIFLSAFLHDHYVEQALKVGALGYLTKGQKTEVLVEAIREVAEDRAFFSDEVQARIVYDSKEMLLTPKGKSRVSTLTLRELEVLRYIARGLSKKEIAGIMHVSVKTVQKHTDNVMKKLEIHDRVKLARFAIREGLAEP